MLYQVLCELQIYVVLNITGHKDPKRVSNLWLHVSSNVLSQHDYVRRHDHYRMVFMWSETHCRWKKSKDSAVPCITVLVVCCILHDSTATTSLQCSQHTVIISDRYPKLPSSPPQSADDHNSYSDNFSLRLNSYVWRTEKLPIQKFRKFSTNALHNRLLVSNIQEMHHCDVLSANKWKILSYKRTLGAQLTYYVAKHQKTRDVYSQTLVSHINKKTYREQIPPDLWTSWHKCHLRMETETH